MAQDHFGVFDTPPSRREKWLAIAIVIAVSLAVLLIWPARNVRLGEVNAIIPTMNAAMFVAELMIAAMLYGQAAVFRSRALTILASGYVFIALMLAPHTLTYPGAFAPNGLLGAGLGTTAWAAVFRRWAFPIAILLYAVLREDELESQRPPARILTGIFTAVTLAGGASLWITIGQDFLPPFFIDRNNVIQSRILVMNLVTVTLLLPPMFLLLKRNRSVLDTWLLVALSCWIAQSILNSMLVGRFTLGAYSLYGIMMLSSVVVMLALMAESNRLLSKLVVSVAARDRERDARLTSMDAVAAAIAHEIGQPLTAVTLSATAGLKWLKREQPDPDMAIKSLTDTTEAARRTFDVIKSIRASFSKHAGVYGEINLNQLVSETASLLDTELTAHGISLQLKLEEALPPVTANRAQIQRVLINLLINAIDALAATPRRARSIAIRSATEGPDVLIEVSDSGIGIAPDTLAQIFEPFVTTKAKGTGLGLSLSRTIVEDHGGRLWASSGKGRGATFHLKMPVGGFEAQAVRTAGAVMT